MYEVIVFESNKEKGLSYKFHSWDEASRFIDFNNEHGFKCILTYVLADEDRF